MGTTSQKLTYLNDTKTKIRDGINAIGGSLDSDDTFRSYADELESLYNDMPKVSDTGTDITLDNTRVGKMILDYNGDTQQESEPTPSSPVPIQVVTGRNDINVCGKNVLNVSNDNAYINALNNPDITTTYNQNKTIYKVNSLPQQYSQAGYYYAFHTRIGETYKVKVKWTNTTSTPIANIRICSDTTGTTIINNMTSETEYTFTSSQETYYFRVWIGANIGEGYIENPIISTIDTTYESYTDYTQEINLGKNLFNKDNANILNMHLTNNTKTSTNSVSNRTLYIPVKPNTTYTISKVSSVCFTIGTTATTPTFNMAYEQNQNGSTATSLTITTNANANYLMVWFYNAGSDTLTEQQILDSIQIEKGSTKSDYASYFTPIELCKISTYQDYLFYNTPSSPYYNNELQDYKWYLHKEIGKVVLDENTSGLNYANGVLYSNNIGILFTAFTEMLSTCFVYGGSVSNTTGAYNKGNNKICNNSDRKSIYIRNDNLTSLANWTTWLSSNNVPLYYALATSTDTEITNSTLISQLENIKRSIAGQTNISQDNSDLPFIITASALKEWE